MNLIELIRIDDLHAHYGGSHVLKGIDIKLFKGEICCILGRNGMGKTTTLKSIMGLIPNTKGKIYFDARDISNWKPWERANIGIGYIPQGRGIFPRLTVYENIAVCKKRIEEKDFMPIYELFPQLKEREKQLANNLSGGERQMLACARALVRNPQLILMDEPSEGLSPGMVEQVRKTIIRMHEGGRSILLVEQNVSMSLDIADKVYLVQGGEVKYEGVPTELAQRHDLIKKYVGV